MSEQDRLENEYLSASESLHQLLTHLFAQLTPEEVEEFYQGYRSWRLQQQIVSLREQIELVRRQIAVNEQRIQRTAPSAIAQAAIARLQSQGVTSVDLLDRMLERGEEWLDHTMQLLDHCERLGIIYGDYTQWCEHALEGAYDWLASMINTDHSAPAQAAELSSVEPAQSGITEELLLRKLMSEAEEEEEETDGDRAALQASTLPIIPNTPVLGETNTTPEVDKIASASAEQAQAAGLAVQPLEMLNAEEDADLAATETPVLEQDEDEQKYEDNDDDEGPTTAPDREHEHEKVAVQHNEKPIAKRDQEEAIHTPEVPVSPIHGDVVKQQTAARPHPAVSTRPHRRLKEQVARHTLREAMAPLSIPVPNYKTRWSLYT